MLNKKRLFRKVKCVLSMICFICGNDFYYKFNVLARIILMLSYYKQAVYRPYFTEKCVL